MCNVVGSRAPSPESPPVRARAGFTLIELLVALVLLDLGVIALAGASAAVSRVQSGASGDTHTLELVTSRIERTLSTSCASAESGSAEPARGAVEWWTDTPAPNGVRFVSDSVVVTTPHGHRALVVHAAGRC